MNLQACNGCAVVFDLEKLAFPPDIYDRDGCVDITRAAWDGRQFVPKVPCPICKTDIIQGAHP